MGCFDTVLVPCPDCGTREQFQSKSGDCTLASYDLESAPADVLLDVNRHSPYQCTKCGTSFDVDLSVSGKPRRI